MSSQLVPIHRSNTNSTGSTNKNEIWFNAFDYAPGEDANIRWLSRPNQQLMQGKHSHDTEKFRITFDVENFQPEQIKIYIENRKLTISGVYEEHSEGRFMQKKFERSFDIPANADVDAMASFITAAHMLVVEIPLNSSAQVDHLNVGSNKNDQRRVSFSLNKFNTSDNQGLSSTSNDSSSLSTPGQAVRRSSVTKTTTTTTTTTNGSSGLSPEIAELLKSAETTTGSNTHTSSTHTTERHSSNTGNQQATITEPQTSSSSSTSSKQTTLKASDLANLPLEIPPELLASGGTITITKRKVSVSKGTDGSTDHAASTPVTHSNNTQSSSTTSTSNTTHNTNQATSVPINRSDNTTQSTSSTTTNTTHNTDQAVAVPINRSNNTTQSTSSTTTNTTNSTPSNTLNQQQSSTNERSGSKTLSSSNQSRMFTLEEFLQNKTWNPSLVDGSDGKKILYMRLQMKPGTTLDQMKISLNGHNLRVEVDNKVAPDGGQRMSEHSYRQVTLFPTCEVEQLKTELKDDGFLHVQVPIKL